MTRTDARQRARRSPSLRPITTSPSFPHIEESEKLVIAQQDSVGYVYEHLDTLAHLPQTGENLIAVSCLRFELAITLSASKNSSLRAQDCRRCSRPPASNRSASVRLPGGCLNVESILVDSRSEVENEPTRADYT